MSQENKAIQKALEKSQKLATKGKYEEAIRVLLPYQAEPHVKKIIQTTKGLQKAAKDLHSDPLHGRFKFSAKRKGNKISITAKEKRGCWFLRF